MLYLPSMSSRTGLAMQQSSCIRQGSCRNGSITIQGTGFKQSYGTPRSKCSQKKSIREPSAERRVQSACFPARELAAVTVQRAIMMRCVLNILVPVA